MPANIRTIGVANDGGDCAGLNAVIRGVVRTAILEYGWRVIGVTNGFDGLIWPERSTELTLESVAGLLSRGGTVLGTTNRGNPFAYCLERDGRTDPSGDQVRAARAVGISFGDRP